MLVEVLTSDGPQTKGNERLNIFLHLLTELSMGGVSNKMAAKPSQQVVELNEEEMEDRHELPPGRSLPPHLPPPQDGRCFLLDCHADIFEMVLDRVSIRDLRAFMVTSKSAKGVIDQYVRHRLKKDQR